MILNYAGGNSGRKGSYLTFGRWARRKTRLKLHYFIQYFFNATSSTKHQ